MLEDDGGLLWSLGLFLVAIGFLGLVDVIIAWLESDEDNDDGGWND